MPSTSYSPGFWPWSKTEVYTYINDNEKTTLELDFTMLKDFTLISGRKVKVEACPICGSKQLKLYLLNYDSLSGRYHQSGNRDTSSYIFSAVKRYSQDNAKLHMTLSVRCAGDCEEFQADGVFTFDKEALVVARPGLRPLDAGLEMQDAFYWSYSNKTHELYEFRVDTDKTVKPLDGWKDIVGKKYDPEAAEAMADEYTRLLEVAKGNQELAYKMLLVLEGVEVNASL